MNTLGWLAVAAIVCVLLTGYVAIAFVSYGNGHRSGYKEGLAKGAEISRNVRANNFGIPAEQLGGGNGI